MQWRKRPGRFAHKPCRSKARCAWHRPDSTLSQLARRSEGRAPFATSNHSVSSGTVSVVVAWSSATLTSPGAKAPLSSLALRRNNSAAVGAVAIFTGWLNQSRRSLRNGRDYTAPPNDNRKPRCPPNPATPQTPLPSTAIPRQNRWAVRHSIRSSQTVCPARASIENALNGSMPPAPVMDLFSTVQLAPLQPSPPKLGCFQ